MNLFFRFLFCTLLFVSCADIHGMADQEEEQNAAQLLADPAARMAAIRTLAQSLEKSLANDAEYYQLTIYKYRVPNSKNLKEFAAKTDLVKPTQSTIKAILQLTDIPAINPALLENVISGIPSFKIKYVAATASELPKTAQAKKLNSHGYAVKDHTDNFKDHMLCALHGLSTKVHKVTVEQIA